MAEALADVRFPISKEELVRRHEWKIIDLDERSRVPASVTLNSSEEELQEPRRGLKGTRDEV